MDGRTRFLCLWFLALCLGFLQLYTAAQSPITSRQQRWDKETAYFWLLLYSWLLCAPFRPCFISNEQSKGLFADTVTIYTGHIQTFLDMDTWSFTQYSGRETAIFFGGSKIKQQRTRGRNRGLFLYFFLLLFHAVAKWWYPAESWPISEQHWPLGNNRKCRLSRCGYTAEHNDCWITGTLTGSNRNKWLSQSSSSAGLNQREKPDYPPRNQSRAGALLHKNILSNPTFLLRTQAPVSSHLPLQNRSKDKKAHSRAALQQ